MKILLTYKSPQVDNPVACHVGLGATALNTVMALRERRMDADLAPIANGEHLWAMLNGDWAACSHVVLCAPFVDAPFLGKLAANFPRTAFALVYHSNLGFLSVDRFAARSIPHFLDIAQANQNFYLASNSEELSSAISVAAGRPMAYLPNLYHLPHFTRRARERWKPPMALEVGLFGAARALKNWLTAGAAVMMLQRKIGVPVRFHLNSGRDEGAEGSRTGLNALLSLNPNVSVVDVPWLSPDDFRRYLYGMDLLLQPSFTETFNNVTADGCACGVPSVVSDAITWAPDSWKARADSAAHVAQTAYDILRDSRAASRGQRALDAHNDNAMAAWNDWLAAA